MTEDDDGPRCDFCRLHMPAGTVTVEHDDVTYEFCSTVCREAMDDADRVFTEYHGHRRFRPGVSALSSNLPQGMPRNAFVLLSGQAGTRQGAIQAELVWRTLQRGERAVIVALAEPPMAIVERFLTLDWNVLPYLESDDLHLLDGFTYRLDDPERVRDRMSEWNQHLHRAAAPATTVVRDPSDTGELENKLDSVLDDRGMVDTGIAVIDSLTELGSLLQPVQAYDYVKNVRADICKGRFVPVFAGATYAGDVETFPHDLDYIVDGIVDLELNGGIVEDTLLKRIRIRKMSGVLSISEWTAYEYTSDLGLVTFDPEEEIERSRMERSEADVEKRDEDALAEDESGGGDGSDGAAAEGEDGDDGAPGAASGPRERPE